MTPTTWALLAVLVPTAALALLFWVAEKMRRQNVIATEMYRPAHQLDGETRRLPRAPRINLVPEPGQKEWTFPARPDLQ